MLSHFLFLSSRVSFEIGINQLGGKSYILNEKEMQLGKRETIEDTARVLDLSLQDADRIAKLVPDMKLNKMFGMKDNDLEKKLGNPDLIENARELKIIYDQDNLSGETLRKAKELEGSVRNTGIHACGVIVTPSDIREYVPVSVAKDSSMWCTQFDNSVVEDAGLLKMDFLGLKTLTLIKDAVSIVKERHNVEIDPEEIPIDDLKTYELFQRGETVGVFQYESAGMQKYMKELKPTVFADLIAMNALYRPGPIEYIPSFIKRKHGEEPISYDLEGMDEYLEETYGITVYQEQVMRLSQKLAGFTKGQADSLRKAMGKKLFSMLEQLKPLFINGGKERKHSEEMLEKVYLTLQEYFLLQDLTELVVEVVVKFYLCFLHLSLCTLNKTLHTYYAFVDLTLLIVILFVLN